jgi:hypothetical protein
LTFCFRFKFLLFAVLFDIQYTIVLAVFTIGAVDREFGQRIKSILKNKTDNVDPLEKYRDEFLQVTRWNLQSYFAFFSWIIPICLPVVFLNDETNNYCFVIGLTVAYICCSTISAPFALQSLLVRENKNAFMEGLEVKKRVQEVRFTVL